jgi:hypothetical protein
MLRRKVASRAGEVAQVVVHLPEALNSNPSTTKKRRREKRRGGRGRREKKEKEKKKKPQNLLI